MTSPSRRAIVAISGKQYAVEAGRYIDIDTLTVPDDAAELTFDTVLFAQDGEQVWVGAPQIAGAVVRGTIVKHDRHRKIIVYKMRCKKGYRRKHGHRQGYTRFQVTSIDLPKAAS